MDFIKKIKDFFGESNEIANSTAIALEDRLTSPFFGYFLISWCAVNWRLLYIAFFVSGEETVKVKSLLRDEYLLASVPPVESWSYWLHFLIAPFILTIFIFWVLPFISRIFFKKNIRNQKLLKIIELQERNKEQQKEKELVKTETALIKEKVEQEKQLKRAAVSAPEVVWQKEYNEFKKNKLFPEFGKVVRKYYNNGSNDYENISVDMVAFLDLKELGSGNGKNKPINFTNKGKYFAKRYIEEFPIPEPVDPFPF